MISNAIWNELVWVSFLTTNEIAQARTGSAIGTF